VTLPETATTGYQWLPEFDRQVLGPVGDETIASPVPRGAPGTHVFRFEALAPGQTLLRLVKRRPWESEPKDEIAVELAIEPR
jgi:predicted secreted protein